MFKTHKIWFSPEFALHLGTTPAGTRRTHSHPRGPPTKDFLNLLSTLVHLRLFASLQAVQSEISSKIMCVWLALISPWLALPSYPTSIFMPHHAHLLSMCPGADGDGGCCSICMVRHTEEFLAVADLVNFSPLAQHKVSQSGTALKPQTKNPGMTPNVCWLNFDWPLWVLCCIILNIFFPMKWEHCPLFGGKKPQFQTLIKPNAIKCREDNFQQHKSLEEFQHLVHLVTERHNHQDWSNTKHVL